MIYLVSDKIDVTNMPEVQKISPEKSLHMIKQWPVVQFDTETTGLDPHICSLTALQFGYKDFKSGEHNEIVVDAKTIDPILYKGVLESSHLIAHNYKFDAQFLYNYGIVPLDVYDTMVCEQTLYLGYKPGRVSMALGDVLYRYTGIKLDKSFQKFIARQGLTYQGILYAAGDVTYLQDIRKAQLMVAQSRNCTRALTVENRFVPAVAYLEWCGIHLDEDLWKKKMEKDNVQYETCLTKLNEYVMNHTALNTRFVTTYSEPSIFDDNPSFTPTCNVDWDSSAQVIPVFKALGFNTWSEKEHRDTVEEKHLTPQKGINDEFLKIYLDYKKSSKTITSYGQGHLNLINPNTGRLHTEFKSIGTVTGRMSSGGGDDEDSKGKINADLAFFKGLPTNEVRYVNLQNLPSRGEAGKITRACFTAEPGNVFISCDYAAEESRVQADVWNEKKLLDAFEHGIDTHSLYAKMCYPEELKDVDVKDVKSKRPDLRQNAKYFEFELGYGGNGTETAKKLGLDKEKTMQNVANVQKEMPGMMAFKKKTGKFLKEHGYIVINEITGHRVYWPEWASWKAEEDRYDRHFWDDYKMNHKGTDDEVAKRVRKHMRDGGDWFNKNVLNYPIQGGSAVVLKEAAANLFEWVIKNNYFNIVKFCVFVHDEIDVECPEKLSQTVATQITDIMKKASARYYKKLAIPSDANINTFWEH